MGGRALTDALVHESARLTGPSPVGALRPLRVRWLGRVPYREALAVQTALFSRGHDDHLLLLEHQHVFTHGASADLATNVLVDPASVGAELVAVNRGGDVTYHGPGQLVGYPIVTLAPKHGRSATSGLADTKAYVCSVEQLVIDVLAGLGLANAGRLDGYPGVWIDPLGESPRKICAIGVRLSRGRTMHGFAINVSTDLRYLREYLVPCGIADKAVTSLAEDASTHRWSRSSRSSPVTPRAGGATARSTGPTSRGSTRPMTSRRSAVVPVRARRCGAPMPALARPTVRPSA